VTRVAPLRSLTDGVVTIRQPTTADTPILLAGRDAESRRWLGAGTDDPRPTACIIVGGVVVGWVDYDADQTWLLPGEVNVGYNVFPAFRRNGYASRAVELLLLYLDDGTRFHTATLSIDARNVASLGVAARAGFVLAGDPNATSLDFKRSVTRR
jgi:RimJ/RimL family protein N-acetyltransferase